jgi:hypothetical protein
MPYRRKQLATELASWAELRHDTILYAKQSYSVSIMCEYPEGYVEPYPEFFERLALLADEMHRRLTATVSSPEPRYAHFLDNFRDTMKYLSRLARKELEAKPFTAEESGFLKKTIDENGVGCGPPTYDGWYARLYFGGDAEKWKPTISDVHTDPTSGTVLEEGVGDANFLVAAVDNHGHRAAYVGPAYSYYEFTRPAGDRMTDEAWRGLITKGQLPERPAWWRAAFPAPAKARQFAGGMRHPAETDPRVLAARRVYQTAIQTKDPAARARLMQKADELGEQSDRVPAPPATPRAPVRH